MIEILLQKTLLQEIINACTLNFPLLGCNVLTHVREKVIHVEVNVASVSC